MKQVKDYTAAYEARKNGLKDASERGKIEQKAAFKAGKIVHLKRVKSARKQSSKIGYCVVA